VNANANANLKANANATAIEELSNMQPLETNPSNNHNKKVIHSVELEQLEGTNAPTTFNNLPPNNAPMSPMTTVYKPKVIPAKYMGGSLYEKITTGVQELEPLSFTKVLNMRAPNTKKHGRYTRRPRQPRQPRRPGYKKPYKRQSIRQPPIQPLEPVM
jgi:hypothetical protein